MKPCNHPVSWEKWLMSKYHWRSMLFIARERTALLGTDRVRD
jgi:hypothetical protein